VSQDTKIPALAVREIGGVLRRLFGGNGHEAASVPDAHSNSKIDLRDIQGFILRGYRMPMVRHFLLAVGDPA
jgi:hypothetical protein